MSFNTKNETAHRLARELAALTGETHGELLYDERGLPRDC